MEYFFGYLVATLSTIVMLLLGWQIFSLIKLNKTIATSIASYLAPLKQEQDKKLNMIKCEAIGSAMYNLGEYQLAQKAYYAAFSSFIKALSNLHEENPSNAEVQLCFDKLEYIIDSINHEDLTIVWNEYVRNTWVEEMAKIKDPRKIKIIKFLVESRVAPS